MLSTADDKRDCYEQLVEFATCPSCQRITTDIKLLPCMDFCCLECLKQQLSRQNESHEMDCCSCGQTFSIPQEGLEHLPSNSYIQAVVTMLSSTHRHQASEPQGCSVCDDVTKTAKLKYCKECRQYLCEQCAMVHHNIRLTRAHHVVDSHQSKFLVDCDTAMCPHHPSKTVQVVCDDCTSCLCCLTCLHELHRHHNWTDINQVTDTLRQQLHEDMQSVKRAAELCDEQLQSLNIAERMLTEHIEDVKQQTDSHTDQIIAAINHEVGLLREKLSHAQNANLERLSQNRDQMKKQKQILECFERFCESIIDTGTVHELFHVHNSIHGTGEELPLQHAASCDVNISHLRFTPVDLHDLLPRGAQHLIGSVSGDENAVKYPTWSELHSELQQAREQTAELQQQANDNQHSMACLEEQLMDRNNLMDKAMHQLEEKNSLIANLEQQKSDMASDMKEKENAVNSLKEELQQKDSMLDELRMQTKNLCEQVHQTEVNYQSQLHECELRLAKTAAELQDWQLSDTQQRVCVNKLNVRMQQLEESLSHSVTKEQQMETELEDAWQHVSEQSFIIEHIPPTAGQLYACMYCLVISSFITGFLLLKIL